MRFGGADFLAPYAWPEAVSIQVIAGVIGNIYTMTLLLEAINFSAMLDIGTALRYAPSTPLLNISTLYSVYRTRNNEFIDIVILSLYFIYMASLISN